MSRYGSFPLRFGTDRERWTSDRVCRRYGTHRRPCLRLACTRRDGDRSPARQGLSRLPARRGDAASQGRLGVQTRAEMSEQSESGRDGERRRTSCGESRPRTSTTAELETERCSGGPSEGVGCLRSAPMLASSSGSAGISMHAARRTPCILVLTPSSPCLAPLVYVQILAAHLSAAGVVRPVRLQCKMNCANQSMAGSTLAHGAPSTGVV